jgi:RNA polymerase primary sigma factor
MVIAFQACMNELISRIEELKSRVLESPELLPALNEAKHSLAVENLRLVMWVAGQHRDSGLPFEDLVQEGSIGLLRAVDKFSASRGFKFSTYAVWWIRRSILRALQNKSRTIRLPIKRQADLARLQAAAHRLAQTQMRPATTEEASREAGLRLSRAELLYFRARPPLSLFAPYADEGGRLLDRIAAPLTTAEPQDTARLERFLCILSDPERRVVALRFGLQGRRPHTLREIGRILGVSGERIRQIERRALLRLREAIGVWD